MSEDEKYDEFGNLIGDPFDSDADSIEESEVEISEQESEQEADINVDEDMEKEGTNNALIVHDAQKNGKTLRGMYGSNVEAIVVKPYEESADVPVIQPLHKKKMKVEFADNVTFEESDNITKNLPKLIYPREYMLSTMKQLPERIRNVAMLGNLHSGKTSFVDMLVLQTHSPSISLSSSLKNFKPLRYMDNHKIEIDRGLSIKTSPITLLLPDLNDKSYVFNIIDTPGHVNFFDETLAAIQAVDGAILVLDAVEGLTPRDKSILKEVLKNDLPLTVVINKIDRLILELRLPAPDFYYKIKYIIDDINAIINGNEYISTYTQNKRISPDLNNIIFASSTLEFSFTLTSFAKLYFDNSILDNVDPEQFRKRLWGDVYYNPKTNKFTRDSNNGAIPRSFNFFILEPIYKIITYTLTFDTTGKKLSLLLWQNFGITLHKSQYKQDPQILLKDVFSKVFASSKGFVDSITSTIPSPNEFLSNKLNTLLGTSSLPKNGLVANVVKLIESSDAEKFYSLVRIYQGSLKVGTKIKVLGENFKEDDEDYKIEVIDELYVPGGRYKIPVKEVGTGSLAIVSGIDSIITKGATFYSHTEDNVNIFRQINYGEQSIFKVAIEPANPSELPKLLEGLRKLNKSYLALVIKVEESGEHVIFAPGELYLDCVFHDLRNFFTDDLEIRISDPMTKFSETCIDTSTTKITTKSNNNQISIIAEPINDKKLSHAIESGRINISQPIKTTSKILRQEFDWDALSARSVWCFGPDDLQYPSILLDDTLESDTDKKLLYSVKDSISLGFQWSVNEGPLCNEPIRNTKFKILDAVISGSEIQRSGTQIIPMTRKACYTGFLTASPRLMEPMYTVNVTCNSQAIPAISKLLSKRRGRVIKEEPIPGTQLFQVEGFVPVIDSVGLESDIRLQTQGQAMCFLVFERWDIVPGDPLDKDCFLPPLKPVPYKSLARDFVMKTRKRKGLTGEPNLQKYIDAELFEKLKESGIID